MLLFTTRISETLQTPQVHTTFTNAHILVPEANRQADPLGQLTTTDESPNPPPKTAKPTTSKPTE